LASVPHSGELLGPEHVRRTLAYLNPDRLGHGVRSAEDPETLSRVVDSGVALEVCPASNVALGVYPTIAEVPLRTLTASGRRDPLKRFRGTVPLRPAVPRGRPPARGLASRVSGLGPLRARS